MKKLISFVFIGLLPLFMIRGEASDTTPLAERMDELGVPGVSVAVIDDGKIAWARGWGLADVASGRPVTPEMLFQAASISKPVAAVAAPQLVENGTIDLGHGGANEGWLIIPGSPELELLPESATSFFVRLDGRPVAFEFEGDDVVIVAAGRRGQKVGG